MPVLLTDGEQKGCFIKARVAGGTRMIMRPDYGFNVRSGNTGVKRNKTGGAVFGLV